MTDKPISPVGVKATTKPITATTKQAQPAKKVKTANVAPQSAKKTTPPNIPAIPKTSEADAFKNRSIDNYLSTDPATLRQQLGLKSDASNEEVKKRLARYNSTRDRIFKNSIMSNNIERFRQINERHVKLGEVSEPSELELNMYKINLNKSRACHQLSQITAAAR